MHVHGTFVTTSKSTSMKAQEQKQAVINFLKHDRTLLGGRNLYNKLAGKNLAFQRQLGRWTNTPTNVERLCHELARTVGLETRLLRVLIQKPLERTEERPEETAPLEIVKDKTPEEKLMEFDIDNGSYQEAVAMVKELELQTNGRKHTDLKLALSQTKSELIKEQVSGLPKEVKASIKLREQFPFLRDADCPDPLKLLVNDLITSYEKFKENQPRLHENLSDASAEELADVVLRDYVSNKMAWSELEYYKENGKVLGEHPIFEVIKEKEEISALKTDDLAKKIKNLENNISRNKNKGNDELVEKQETLLAHAKQVLEKR